MPSGSEMSKKATAGFSNQPATPALKCGHEETEDPPSETISHLYSGGNGSRFGHRPKRGLHYFCSNGRRSRQTSTRARGGLLCSNISALHKAGKTRTPRRAERRRRVPAKRSRKRPDTTPNASDVARSPLTLDHKMEPRSIVSNGSGPWRVAVSRQQPPNLNSKYNAIPFAAPSHLRHCGEEKTSQLSLHTAGPFSLRADGPC